MRVAPVAPVLACFLLFASYAAAEGGLRGNVNSSGRIPSFANHAPRLPASSPLETGRRGSIGVGPLRYFPGRTVKTTSSSGGVEMTSTSRTRGWAWVSKPKADGTFTVKGKLDSTWKTVMKTAKFADTVKGTTATDKYSTKSDWNGRRSDGSHLSGSSQRLPGGWGQIQVKKTATDGSTRTMTSSVVGKNTATTSTKSTSVPGVTKESQWGTAWGKRFTLREIRRENGPLWNVSGTKTEIEGGRVKQEKTSNSGDKRHALIGHGG